MPRHDRSTSDELDALKVPSRPGSRRTAPCTVGGPHIFFLSGQIFLIVMAVQAAEELVGGPPSPGPPTDDEDYRQLETNPFEQPRCATDAPYCLVLDYESPYHLLCTKKRLRAFSPDRFPGCREGSSDSDGEGDWHLRERSCPLPLPRVITVTLCSPKQTLKTRPLFSYQAAHQSC
jgi:hypothetical protein